VKTSCPTAYLALHASAANAPSALCATVARELCGWGYVVRETQSIIEEELVSLNLLVQGFGGEVEVKYDAQHSLWLVLKIGETSVLLF
jgi:hypothetical protein